MGRLISLSPRWANIQLLVFLLGLASLRWASFSNHYSLTCRRNVMCFAVFQDYSSGSVFLQQSVQVQMFLRTQAICAELNLSLISMKKSL